MDLQVVFYSLYQLYMLGRMERAMYGAMDPMMQRIDKP